MKDDLISRKNLYEQTEKWEEQAKKILSTLDPIEDEDEYARWEIILRERTAFKRDIIAAPAKERDNDKG